MGHFPNVILCYINFSSADFKFYISLLFLNKENALHFRGNCEPNWIWICVYKSSLKVYKIHRDVLLM